MGSQARKRANSKKKVKKVNTAVRTAAPAPTTNAKRKKEIKTVKKKSAKTSASKSGSTEKKVGDNKSTKKAAATGSKLPNFASEGKEGEKKVEAKTQLRKQKDTPEELRAKHKKGQKKNGWKQPKRSNGWFGKELPESRHGGMIPRKYN